MIRNFLFHRVSPTRDPLWDPMDVALFEKCVRTIARKYEVVRIEDLVPSDRLYSKGKLATIMFDDGYKDNIEYAAPILERYNCKASFYVVTDCIEKNVPTWTHVLEHTFQFTNIAEVSFNTDLLPDELRVQKLPTQNDRLKYVRILKPFLKKVAHETRNTLMEGITTTYTDVVMPELMMSWGDLKELAAAGHYIGSHTVTHSMLGTMTDETEIMFELTRSAEEIKKQMGYFPLTISYPVGSFNETTKRLSSQAGYKIGLAVQQGLYSPARHDPFEIPRIELYNEPWWKTQLRISNTLERIKSAIRYK